MWSQPTPYVTHGQGMQQSIPQGMQQSIPQGMQQGMQQNVPQQMHPGLNQYPGTVKPPKRGRRQDTSLQPMIPLPNGSVFPPGTRFIQSNTTSSESKDGNPIDSGGGISGQLQRPKRISDYKAQLLELSAAHTLIKKQLEDSLVRNTELKQEIERLNARYDAVQKDREKWMTSQMERMTSDLRSSHSDHIQSLKQTQQQMAQVVQGTMITLHASVTKARHQLQLPSNVELPPAPRRYALEYVTKEKQAHEARTKQPVSAAAFTSRLQEVEKKEKEVYKQKIEKPMIENVRKQLSGLETDEAKREYLEKQKQELITLQLMIDDQKLQMDKAKRTYDEWKTSESTVDPTSTTRTVSTGSSNAISTLGPIVVSGTDSTYTKTQLKEQIDVAEDQLSALECKKMVLENTIAYVVKHVSTSTSAQPTTHTTNTNLSHAVTPKSTIVVSSTALSSEQQHSNEHSVAMVPSGTYTHADTNLVRNKSLLDSFGPD